MSGTLPTVRGSAQALYPVTRNVEFLTDVAIGLNASEQRFKRRPPLTRFVLPYTRMKKSDVTAMSNFFNSQKGSFDSTWSFTLGTTTYAGLTFEDDTFTFREESGSETTYSFSLRVRQTQNPGQTAGSVGTAFPALSTGSKSQLPYVAARRFAALLNDNPIGPRYSYTWFGGSLSGFPSGALHGWVLSFGALTDADLATREAHFRNNWGRWGTFSFTDPDDSTVYANCRYDDDVFAVTHIGPNQNSVTLKILETN